MLTDSRTALSVWLTDERKPYFSLFFSILHLILTSRAAEKHDTTVSSCSAATLPHGVSTAARVCVHAFICASVVWMVSLSSPPTLLKPQARASINRWPAKVIYLSLSSIYSSTQTCMRTHTQTHCPHWATGDCRRDTFIKDLQAALCLFVCICDYGLAAFALFSLMSYPQCRSQNTVLCASLYGAIL